jgi:hypothetical protein
MIAAMRQSVGRLTDDNLVLSIAQMPYGWQGPWCLDPHDNLVVLDPGHLILTTYPLPSLPVEERPLQRDLQAVSPSQERTLRSPADLVGRVLTGCEEHLGYTELQFGESRAFIILDDPHGLIETGRVAERYAEVRLAESIGATITQVVAYCGSGHPNPVLRSLSFSNGTDAAFFGDVGAPLLLPERATPFTLLEANPHQSAGPWLELAGRMVVVAKRGRRGVLLKMQAGEAELHAKDVKLFRRDERAQAERGVAVERLSGQVITWLELLYEPQGNGLPTEVRLSTDASGDLVLRRPDRSGIALGFNLRETADVTSSA